LCRYHIQKLVLVDSNPDDHDGNAERQREIAARKDDPRFKEAIAAMTSGVAPATDDEFAAFLTRILPLFFYDPVESMPRFARTSTAPPFDLGISSVFLSGQSHPEARWVTGSRAGKDARDRRQGRLHLPGGRFPAPA
jgi:hypothetical protein